MSVLDLARIMIYRMHEKGLEIFLIKPDLNEDPDVWKLPQGIQHNKFSELPNETIDLETVRDAEGENHRFLAIQGDWHDIPSIRGIVKHDIKRAKRKIEKALPGLDNGIFISVKDTVHKLLPHDNQAVFELEEIIRHRNMIKNI